MGRSSKRSEENREDFESGSEIDSIDSANDMLLSVSDGSEDDEVDDRNEHENGGRIDSDDDEEATGVESDVEEDEEEENGEEEEQDYDHDVDDDHEGNEESHREGKLNEEMKQLEKEVLELRHQEQDILRNLKRHKDDDIIKGQAVKNQKALWDKSLELRFLLQKAFSYSNRLPQEPVRSLFCSSCDGVNDAYSDLIISSKKTLDSMLELQEALLEKNPTIAQSADVNSSRSSRYMEVSENSSAEGDEEWSKVSQMQSRMASFRDKSIDKWHRRTQVTTGAAAIKSKLQAFNQDISDQVAAYMRDPSKMIKGMQQSRSAVALFGTVPDAPENIEEVVSANGDPDILDDSEFYQQLLKEFFETIDPTSSETAFYALKRLQTKKRKIVDRRASKSRKIRYHVHEKIVNFMAPQPMDIPDAAPKLFQNLFGLRR